MADVTSNASSSEISATAIATATTATIHSENPQAPPPQGGVSFSVAPDPGDDTSLLISAKLLQGWALLDAACYSPACNGSVPLMRNRRGQVRYKQWL